MILVAKKSPIYFKYVYFPYCIFSMQVSYHNFCIVLNIRGSYLNLDSFCNLLKIYLFGNENQNTQFQLYVLQTEELQQLRKNIHFPVI